MSMNLHCNNVELWQTPTYITYMCMALKDGYSFEFKGVNARRALYAYMQWAMSRFDSFCGTDEELKVHNANRKYAVEHCDTVREAIKSRGLRVYVM